MSSIADSSATTSPARTGVPFCTLMVASWPPTSGATRISVVRTTPTIGAAGSERHRRYRPAPTAATTRPSAMTRRRPLLAMRPPPLHDGGRHHRQREIGDGQPPQGAPIVRHLRKARAQLIEADDAVDGGIRREYVTRGKHRPGDCFARPGKTGKKELRQTGGKEDEHRGLGAPEPGARRLAHEAGRENEQRRKRKQLQWMAER